MTGVAPDKTAILSLDTTAAGDDALRTVLGAPAGCKLRAAPEHFLSKTGCESIVVGNSGAEFFVDWLKHAFITRFNEVSAEVYKDYTISLAYDLATTKQKHVSASNTVMHMYRGQVNPWVKGSVPVFF